MPVIEFTDNFEDLSTDQGFQFKFRCERCGDGFMSSFQTNTIGVAGSLLRGAGDLLGGIFGQAASGAYEVQRAVGGPQHDAALRAAVDEVKPLFHKCRRCGNWLCERTCWNGTKGMCKQCAPVAEEEESSMRAEHVRTEVANDLSLEERPAHERQGEGSGREMPRLRHSHPREEVLPGMRQEARRRGSASVATAAPSSVPARSSAASAARSKARSVESDRPAQVQGVTMHRGAILEAIRKENRNSVVFVSILTAVLAAVLLINWKYMYNFAAGPFRFDAALAAAPGAREFVPAEGTLLPTGMSQETTFRLFRGAVETKSISANYMAMLAGDRFLVVKVEPEIWARSSRDVTTPCPSEQRFPRLGGRSRRGSESLLSAPAGPEELPARRQPLRDGRDASPPAVAAPAGLRLVAGGTRRAPRRPEATQPAGSLAGRRGPRRDGPGGRGREGEGGPTLDHAGLARVPRLDRAPLRCGRPRGRGPEDLRHQERPEAHAALLAEEQMLADTHDVSAEEARAVLAALAERMPWTVKDDVAVFEKRWSDDREACAREADAQRRAAPGQPPSVARP